jgi:hypothetical protein
MLACEFRHILSLHNDEEGNVNPQVSKGSLFAATRWNSRWSILFGLQKSQSGYTPKESTDPSLIGQTDTT